MLAVPSFEIRYYFGTVKLEYKRPLYDRKLEILRIYSNFVLRLGLKRLV